MHTQNNYIRKISIPSSVKVQFERKTLLVEGPLGTLHIDISLYDPSNLMNIQVKEKPISQIVVQSYYQYAKTNDENFFNNFRIINNRCDTRTYDAIRSSWSWF